MKQHTHEQQGDRMSFCQLHLWTNKLALQKKNGGAS
jgi:hypothetical protein